MISNANNIINWLMNQDRKKIYEIKEYTQLRNLNQNSYVWKLITEIGNTMNISKSEVYLEMLESYGQNEVVRILSDISPDIYFKQYGIKYYKNIGTIIIKDKEYKEYLILKGSSQFNNKEMSIFIDGILKECNQLGIATLTTEEFKRLQN